MFLFTFVLLALFPAAAARPAGEFTLYLPIISLGCAPTAPEMALAQLMSQHPEQQRPALNCEPVLRQVARAHATDMAVRNYVSHVSPEGFGPNHRVQEAGYILPANYDLSPAGNNIQLLAVSLDNAQAVFDALYASVSHRSHLLGEGSFAEQIDYGIGYIALQGSAHTHYWVVITARRGP